MRQLSLTFIERTSGLQRKLLDRSMLKRFSKRRKRGKSTSTKIINVSISIVWKYKYLQTLNLYKKMLQASMETLIIARSRKMSIIFKE